MLYIGVDLGTSAVKLLLMDSAGTVQKIVSREYPLSFPQTGWSEQNPLDWYEQTIAGLHQLLSDCDRSQVAGISFGGQMHGLVTLDAEDQVIRPAILWNDGRSTAQTDYLNQTIGKQQLSEYTANIAFAGFTAPKILWMKENEPQNFARICKIMLPKDYLIYRLSGNFATDYSDASGMLLLDVKRRCWSQQMLSICGITEQQLPKLHESYEVVGTLLPQLAEQLGLPSSVRIVAGAGDNAAAAIGTGTVGEGSCNLSLGTSGTLFITSGQFRVDPHNALHAFAHADGHYHLMGCMLSAASCNAWWMQQILNTQDFAAEQKDICRLGENPVFFLPYLMGERSPHNDPHARGAFIGLSMDTTRRQMTQAVLEGVVFALRDSLEVARSLGISLSSTRICGGGAKSPLWKRMVANILNLQVETVRIEEGPAYGAAILAAVGCGEYATVEEAAAQLVQPGEVISPEPELVAAYENRYQLFRQLYPSLAPAFVKMAEQKNLRPSFFKRERRRFFCSALKSNGNGVKEKSNQHDSHHHHTEKNCQQPWFNRLAQHDHRRQRQGGDTHHKRQHRSQTCAFCKQAFCNRDGAKDVSIHRDADEGRQRHRIPMLGAQQLFDKRLRDKVVNQRADCHTDQHIRCHLADGGSHLCLCIGQPVPHAHLRRFQIHPACVADKFLHIIFQMQTLNQRPAQHRQHQTDQHIRQGDLAAKAAGQHDQRA